MTEHPTPFQQQCREQWEQDRADIAHDWFDGNLEHADRVLAIVEWELPGWYGVNAVMQVLNEIGWEAENPIT